MQIHTQESKTRQTEVPAPTFVIEELSISERAETCRTSELTDYIQRCWQTTIDIPENSLHEAKSYAVTASSGQIGGTPQGTVVVEPLPTPSVDKPGLVSLYDSTEGDNWADNTNWLTNVPVGEWHGVTTSDGARGRVSGLLLMGNRLAGRIPSTIGDLTNLETLRLTDNSLRGEIPSELGSLKSLQVLELAHNSLSGEIPPELGGLTNLQSLELFDNRLWGAIPSELGSLAQLQVLDVSDNRLSGEIPTELANLTKLEVLDLFDNNITGAIPEGLGSLANLDTVYLDGNDLSGCIPATWRSLDNEDFDDLGLPFCDVSLSSLTISPGQLDPEFDSGTSVYTAEVDQAQLTITPASLQGATFEFLDGNGEDIPDADETLDGHQVDLDYGVTTIKIKVVSQDGEESHTYTIKVSRLGEPDAPAIIDPSERAPRP